MTTVVIVPEIMGNLVPNIVRQIAGVTDNGRHQQVQKPNKPDCEENQHGYTPFLKKPTSCQKTQQFTLALFALFLSPYILFSMIQNGKHTRLTSRQYYSNCKNLSIVFTPLK